MPELPEAEVSRRGLAPVLEGRLVREAVCTQAGRIVRPAKDAAAFAAALAGRTVTSVERRGKHLLFVLDGGNGLDFGFGLWAEVVLRPAPPAELRGAALTLAGPNGSSPLALCFTSLALSTFRIAPVVPPPVPPPFDALDERLGAELLSALPRRRPALKPFLMDERLLLGLGNGYTDEILWQARLHPQRLAETLDAGGWRRLAAALRDVLLAAVDAGGETGFLDPSGTPGRYARVIHHHGGEPCPRCGHPLAAAFAGKRETNFCPACQPL